MGFLFVCTSGKCSNGSCSARLDGLCMFCFKVVHVVVLTLLPHTGWWPHRLLAELSTELSAAPLVSAAAHKFGSLKKVFKITINVFLMHFEMADSPGLLEAADACLQLCDCSSQVQKQKKSCLAVQVPVCSLV